MNRLIYILYQITLTLMVFWGARAWFTWSWDYDSMTRLCIYGAFVLVSIIYKINNKINLVFNKDIALAFIFLALSIFVKGKNIYGLLESFLQFLPLIFILSDNENKAKHIDFISKVLGFVIIIGAIPYLLQNAGFISLMGVPSFYGDGSHDSYFFTNYFLFLQHFSETFRFRSIFLEPGYLGTLSAFILYLNNYDFKKWQNCFILIGLLLSFSLAGYIAFAIGYLFHLRIENKSIRGPIVFIILLIGVMNIAPLINNGNNYVNELIVQRLQFDEELGIVGNDRFHGDTDYLFEQAFTNGTFMFGLPNNIFDNSDITGAGYKIYILRYGLFSFVCAILFYIVLASSASNRKECMYASILLVFIFLQSATPEMYRWLIPFCLFCRSDGLTYNDYKIV